MIPHRAVAAPVRVGNELHTRVMLDDGRTAVLASLLPELAADPSLRRRYVADAERLRALGAGPVAEVLAVGADAMPPWRLRLDPPGESLESWLVGRAPAPVDEVLALGARLCDALAEIHRLGAVVRDLKPTQVVLGDDRLWLTDVGLARLDVLSSRSASSVVLEGSPYAAPEQLRRTAVDPRCDLYSMGVILWRAFTGVFPYGEVPILFREKTPLVPLLALRPEIPPSAATAIERCLAEDPEGRPAGARDLAETLRGRTGLAALERVACQACGALLPTGLRLCIVCGKAAILITEETGGASLDLVTLSEDKDAVGRLREVLTTVSEPPFAAMNFMTGDKRLYSKAEATQLLRLPVRLYNDLSPKAVEILRQKLATKGLKVTTRKQPSRRRRRTFRGLAAVSIFLSFWMGMPGAPFMVLLGIAFFIASFVGPKKTDALFRLRRAPLALPAADPLVARLGALLGRDTAPDVRERIAELAVAVQRLVEHRARATAAAAEIAMVSEPMLPLVELIEKEVAALRTIDGELGSLEEGAMVRALAASEARKEPPSRRQTLLEGLDRLRELEEQRARRLGRLLEAASLLRRAVELGLRAGDPDAAYRAEIAQALAALD